LDLQDTYLHVPIHPLSQKYLKFAFQGITYQFRALPFGLNVAPMVFTKLVHVLAAHLHCHGVSIIPYLDNWIVQHPDRLVLLQHRTLVLQTLDSAGFILNQSPKVGTESHTGHSVLGHSLPSGQGLCIYSPRQNSEDYTVSTHIHYDHGSTVGSPNLSSGNIPIGFPELGISVCPSRTIPSETLTSAIPTGRSSQKTLPACLGQQVPISQVSSTLAGPSLPSV
jgi:hypothetical protein